MDFPTVKRTMLTGYPEKEPKLYGSDAFNNPVLEGDEILCMNDFYFLKRALTMDAIEVLEYMGAVEKIAKK